MSLVAVTSMQVMLEVAAVDRILVCQRHDYRTLRERTRHLASHNRVLAEASSRQVRPTAHRRQVSAVQEAAVPDWIASHVSWA